MWDDNDPRKDDRQAVISPLDGSQPATAVDIESQLTENSR